jgi:hypothetical protein
MMRPALTFGGGFAAYVVMVRICQTTLMRCFFAALIALGLVLNGLGGAAVAKHGEAGNRSVVIAGISVTLCQYGSNDDGKGGPLVLHGCDQCALCTAPTLPPAGSDHRIELSIRMVVLRPAPILAGVKSASWRVSWPRGPPSA